MFVLLGSDDNNRAGGVEFFVNVFEGRVNPAGNGNAATFDGTPALMSFYLIGTNIYGPNIDSQEWRNQYLAAYNDGHEIGNHGFHGLASDAPRGTVQNWLNNWIEPTHDALLQLGIAPEDIHGYRAAQDVVDPAMYEALKQLGYEYGNSSTTNHSSNSPAWWPGTLDEGWPGGATWDNRNFGEHTDIWEIPQTYATGTSDYCDKDWFDPPINGTGQDWKEDMQETFLQLYNGNRAPLSLCLHSQDWGPTNALASGGSGQLTPTILERQRAMDEFLDWLLSGQFPEVRVISHAQLLDWMRNPVALNGATPQPTATPAPTSQPTATPTPQQPTATATPTSTPQQPTATATPSGQTQVILTQVSASANDAFHSPSGWPGYSHTSNVVYAGAPGGSGPTYGGWRWTGLNIPAGAVVVSAYVELGQAGWGYAFTTTLSLQDAASPASFSQSSTPYHRWQSRTDFETAWSWQRSGPGTRVSTPGLAAGVQELVDRYGGLNTLVLLESGQGVPNGNSHEWQAFDGSPQAAARLRIEWRAPDG
jgi:hypothetical protein